MEQFVPQEEIRRIIISDMVKKRNSIVPDSTLISMKERGYYILSLLSLYFFGIPLVLLRLSFEASKWINGAFEEGSKVMPRDMLLINKCLLVSAICLITSRIYVRGTMDIGDL